MTPESPYDRATKHLRRLSAAHPELRNAVRIVMGEVNALEQARRDALSALEQMTDRATEAEVRADDLMAQLGALEADLAERSDPERGAEQVVTGSLADPALLDAMTNAPGLTTFGVSVLRLLPGPPQPLVLRPEHRRLVEQRVLRVVGTVSEIRGEAPDALVEVWGGGVTGDVRLERSPGARIRLRNGARVGKPQQAGEVSL